MSKHYYTDGKNAQIVIALLKAHGIRKVVASPGTTNITIVGSVQSDPWFEVYSGIDERHSAYLACGLAAESGEPVILSCTGATASRNYLPALTEAYYRKLPILAITSIGSLDNVGQLAPQALDRSVPPKDCVVSSYTCRAVRPGDSTKHTEDIVNAAILDLTKNGGGPVHINLELGWNTRFTTKELPAVRKITRYDWANADVWPEIDPKQKIAIFVGSSNIGSKLEPFIKSHNVAVITSGEGVCVTSRKVSASVVCTQMGACANPQFAHLMPDLIIDIGEVSGDYPTLGFFSGRAPVWRVASDGTVRNRLARLTNVFQCPIEAFVAHYARRNEVSCAYYRAWVDAENGVRAKIGELPFSNPWIARTTAPRIPLGSVMHFGILNSLRSWNLFPINNSIPVSCNVGGFGIDGGVSTLVGASLANPDKIHFGVFGDLAFFYDLNSLGSRHIRNNLRILLVNNGCGSEFNMYFHPGSQFKEHTNDYIAAGGHFGQKSPKLVKHYAEDLGFTYLSATSKEEYLQELPKFLETESDKPVLFECFTSHEEESEAHRIINSTVPFSSQDTAIGLVKSMIPTRVKDAIKILVN